MSVKLKYNYILLLDHNNFYIGYTTQLFKRLKTHFRQLSHCPKIIKKYKIIKILEIIPNGSYQIEIIKTNEYIDKFGKSHVYGAYHCNLDKFQDDYIRNLIKSKKYMSKLNDFISIEHYK